MYLSKWKKRLLTLSLSLLACSTVCEASADKYTQDELAYMPATKQLELFRSGELSPVDVLEAQIARIEKYNGPVNENREVLEDYLHFNGKVNALSHTNFAEARQKAKEAEKRYKDGTARPLEGITVAIKDEIEVKDWVVTQGSLIFKDNPPCLDNSSIVDRMESAGAIFSVQTTTPEFSLASITWSKLFGVTKNPWNLYYSPGGSSGGSGAALSAGFTTLAIGSDPGGSIRVPASMNGLYGFKPPFGRVATNNIQYETDGPLARTFRDMILLQNVITGPSPKVQSSLYPKLDYPMEYPSVKGVKIAAVYLDHWIAAGNDSTTIQAMDKTISQLRKAGATVDIIREDDIIAVDGQEERIYYYGVMSTEKHALLHYADGESFSLLTDYIQGLFKSTDHSKLKPEALIALSDFRNSTHKYVQDNFFSKGYTAILMPTMATPFVPAMMFAGPSYNPVSNGQMIPPQENIMTPLWNVLDRYPVVDVPVLLTEKKVPVGLQVIGNTYHDLDAMRVAAAIDKANEGEQLYTGDRFPDFREEK